MIFRNREVAGRKLAAKLKRYQGERPIILALPRGGVPVGFEVAQALEAVLDVLVVHEICKSGCSEYSVGAIAEGGTLCVSWTALNEVGLTEDDVAARAELEAIEIARRVQAYRGERPLADLSGRTVLLVTDGVATGVAARAAARVARELGAARVILGTPTIARCAELELRGEFEDIVAVDVVPEYFAVGYWYEQFPRVTDQEVGALLRRSWKTSATAPSWKGEGNEQAGEKYPTGGEDEVLSIPVGAKGHEKDALEGKLAVPRNARGLILFVHGRGSTRHSPRNRFLAHALYGAGFATMLFDLLTVQEAAENRIGHQVPLGIDLLGLRVAAVARWTGQAARTRGLRLGCLGAGTGAAAALLAAASVPERIGAVVARGGRPDLLAPATLRRVRAPVLLIVGGRDGHRRKVNEAALADLPGARLAAVPGAGYLFGEPAALAAVAELAAGWFECHFTYEEAIISS
ncbi:MAG TPA: phosphoribosyltransferase family protein [Anaeromyxobacteraceae bacterium]|nr:phosphoribosyltransferase family protein [Anaeromyxobacteraceae bacterium]